MPELVTWWDWAGAAAFAAAVWTFTAVTLIMLLGWDEHRAQREEDTRDRAKDLCWGDRDAVSRGWYWQEAERAEKAEKEQG